MPLKLDTYTENQLAAVSRHVEGLTRTEAYRSVYSVGRSKPATVRSKAAKFFLQPKIKALVEHLQAESLRRVNVTQDKLTRELAAVAFAVLPDLIETDHDGMLRLKPLEALTDVQRRAVKKLKLKKRTHTSEDGSTVVTQETEVELHGKLEALELLGRNLGMFSQRVILDIPQIDYRPEPAAVPVETVPAVPVVAVDVPKLGPVMLTGKKGAVAP